MITRTSYKGRNILSCIRGTVFTGKEIKDWINWHVNNESSKSHIARQLAKYDNIDDDALYTIGKGDYRSSNSYNKFIIMRYRV